MRLVFAILACLALAQCASSGDHRFRAGGSDDAYVIIGVAEAEANTSPHYQMLWRRLNPDGRFRPFLVGRYLEAATNEGNSARVEGIPGEFTMTDIEPGTYALDSVYALVPDGRVIYVANGVVMGPERPSFTVARGEAIYLGIWQVNIENAVAVTRPWRLDEGDLRAVVQATRPVRGEVVLRQTEIVSVPCTPYRVSSASERRVC